MELESELGTIKVSKQHFERERNDSDSWRHIEANFDSESIIDKLHFSEIESIKFQPESMYRPVIIGTGNGSGKVLFTEGENAEKFLKLLKYRWKSWRQNYG